MIWRLPSPKWWHLIWAHSAYVNIIRMKLACHYRNFLENVLFLYKGIAGPRIPAFIVKPDQHEAFPFIALISLQAQLEQNFREIKAAVTYAIKCKYFHSHLS